MPGYGVGYTDMQYLFETYGIDVKEKHKAGGET